jgi:outer membrane protein assembly complex protein YaeT
MPLNPDLNRKACLAIIQRYNEDGRPFAHCELVKGGDPGDHEVIFQITEGNKVTIRGIEFTGNTFVTGARLRTKINSSSKILGLFGGRWDPAVADADALELEKFYKAFGFHDVKVGRELRWAPDGRDVVLVFHVQEGIRYQVQGVPEVIGPKTLPPEQLEAGSRVKAASYYDEATISKDVKTIEDTYGYMGHKAVVRPNPIFSQDVPGMVRLQYEVEEFPQARVGQIVIVGNDRTRQNVILRQVQLFPGQVLTYPDVRVAENNLKRLNIFDPNGTNIEVLDDPADPRFKDLRVNVKETDTGSLLFGVGVNSNSGFTGSIVLNERNFDITRLPTSLDDFLNGTAFRGAGQEFRLEAVPGTVLQRYTATFREPFLFDTPWSLMTSGYFFNRYYNEYTEQRFGGKFSLGRRLNRYWSLLGTVRLEDVGVHSVSPLAPVDYQSVVGDSFLAGFGANLTRDTRDSFMRPTGGSLFNLSYEEVTGSYTFPLVNAVLTNYFATYRRPDGSGAHVLSFHNQVGWAGSNTPVFERFFAGGFNTIRGFQFRGVGPDINGFKVGGDFMLLNSIEYQIPVMANDSVYFVTFVDGGTVAPRFDQISDYRVSAGFGVRLQVPMLGPVPIALDFGFPIVKAASDNTQVFNFWMGFYR